MIKKGSKIEKVNIVFFMTVTILNLASMIGLGNIIPNDTSRLVISQFILVMPGVFYLATEKRSYKQVVCMKKVTPSNIALLVLFTILISPLLTLVNAISMLFFINNTTNTMSNITLENSFLISLLVIAVIPAIFEESIYRGIFYQEYRKANPMTGMLLSALLFAILHGNFNQFSYAFVMGIIFALVIEATDSIISTMFMHFLINGTSALLLYLLPKFIILMEVVYRNAEDKNDFNTMNQIETILGGTNFSTETILDTSNQVIQNMTMIDVITEYGLRALLCGILAFLVYKKIAKNSGRWEYIKNIFKKKDIVKSTADFHLNIEKESLNDKKQKLMTLPLLIAVILCILSMILFELDVRGLL